MEQPAAKPVLKLSGIFASTDTISYGPFKMTLQGGDYKAAVVSVHDYEITLLPQEKKVMAMLIALQGEYLTRKLYDEARDGKKSGQKDIQIYVSSIRKQIGMQLESKVPTEIIRDFQKYFDAANPVRSEGEKGKELPSPMRGAYRLLTPALSS